MNDSPKRRSRLQFSIAALLLLMVPIAVGADLVRRWWQNRPLPWEAYSAKTVEQHLQNGRTVLLNVTADWDINSQTNNRFAIDVAEVRAFCKAHLVVPVKADFSYNDPAVKQLLLQYESRSIPLLIIIPARTPDEPIVLPDLVTQQQVLDVLEEAVSRG